MIFSSPVVILNFNYERFEFCGDKFSLQTLIVCILERSTQMYVRNKIGINLNKHPTNNLKKHYSYNGYNK